MLFDATAVAHAYEASVDKYADQFGDELVTNSFDRAVIEDAAAGIAAGSALLDMGCGPGQVAAFGLALGFRSVGVDLTIGMLLAARRRLPSIGLTCGDVRALPISTGAFDMAVCWYSLHNLPRSLLPNALKDLRRVLAGGGRLLIGTHAGSGEDIIEREWNSVMEHVIITYYSADELCDALGIAGFETAFVRERPPQAHEHQVNKVYVSAKAV